MEQIDIEKLLQEGKIVQTKLRGYSMYPLFVPGREDVRIESCRQDSLHRGDVVLYRRTGGRLVLHRIHHIKNGKYYMVGDNQTEIEGPLEPEQIKGKMTAFIKNGKIIPEDNVYYRMYAATWLFFRPCRPVIGKFFQKPEKEINPILI